MFRDEPLPKDKWLEASKSPPNRGDMSSSRTRLVRERGTSGTRFYNSDELLTVYANHSIRFDHSGQTRPRTRESSGNPASPLHWNPPVPSPFPCDRWEGPFAPREPIMDRESSVRPLSVPRQIQSPLRRSRIRLSRRYMISPPRRNRPISASQGAASPAGRRGRRRPLSPSLPHVPA